MNAPAELSSMHQRHQKLGDGVSPPLPQPRKFANVQEERLHRKQMLAASFRLFSRFGFDEGVAGHITARDPEFTDTFWVNPFGMHFSQIKVSTLIRVDHRGNVVEGVLPVNEAAFAIHSRIHHARPDVVAAAHTHAPHGRAWATLGKPLDIISLDSCAFYNDHVVYDDFDDQGVLYRALIRYYLNSYTPASGIQRQRLMREWRKCNNPSALCALASSAPLYGQTGGEPILDWVTAFSVEAANLKSSGTFSGQPQTVKATLTIQSPQKIDGSSKVVSKTFNVITRAKNVSLVP